MSIITNAIVQVCYGLEANLPSSAAGIASALSASMGATIPVANINPGIAFFCTDSGNLYLWNGSVMVQIGSQGFVNPMTESGDIIYEDPSLGPMRLGIGTSGEVLTVVNGLPVWAATAQSTTFEAGGSVLASDSTINFEGDGTYISVSNPSAGNVKSALNYSALVTALETSLDTTFDAYGSAGSAQSAAESFATSAVATETSRAEAAEALLAPKANPTFTGTVSGITYSMVGADAAGAAATAQSNAETYANSVNTSGTAANLSGTPALPNETTATTQTAGDSSAKLATDAFVLNEFAAPPAIGSSTPAAVTGTVINATTGFQANGAAASGAYLRGNGTDFVSSAIQIGDLPSTGTWAFAGTLSGNIAYTGAGTSTLGTATAPATGETYQNTSPTVTGASTTVALSTSTAPVNAGGNSWTYTLAASESGAASNGWLNASVTLSGYTGSATGNNGTFTITASTSTTITVTNASGTTVNTGVPVLISSASVQSPSLVLSGTCNTGTAGTLNSVTDSWTLQTGFMKVNSMNPAPTGPNPNSCLVISHAGSSGLAYVNIPNLQFQNNAAVDIMANGGQVNFSCQGGTSVYGSIKMAAGPGSFGLSGNLAGKTTFIEGVGGTVTSGSPVVAISATAAMTNTSGTVIGLAIGSGGGASSSDTFTFNPASGTAAFQAVLINPTVEGTSSGEIDVLYVNPTITNTNLTGKVNLFTVANGGTKEFGIDQYGHEVNKNGDTQGSITSASGTTVSKTFANAYASTPTVVVTPTTNAGAFYLSAVSASGFTITYATSGAQTFNYVVMGNPN
jgi:hypothetical protein